MTKTLTFLLLFIPVLLFSQTKNIIALTEKNDLHGVINAVSNGADINQIDQGGFTAVHIAAWNGYIEILNFLLEKGADPNTISKAGSTPIRFASPDAKNLLEIYGAKDVSPEITVPRWVSSQKVYVTTTNINNTPNIKERPSVITNISNFIEKTIYDYPKKSYHLLTNMTTEASINLHEWDTKGNNRLHRAARSGNFVLVQELIEAGLNPHSQNVLGDTPLRFAIENDHLQIVKYLVEDIGLDINHANKEGTTGLILAALKNSTNMIRYLLHLGANVNKTANANVVRTINGVDQMTSIKGWTALMAAAQLGNNAAIQLLLAGGANINATDSDNWTALLFAVQNEHYETAQQLITQGININTESVDNHTALSLAMLNEDDRMIAMLQQYNAAESSVPLVSYENLPSEDSVYDDEDMEDEYGENYEEDSEENEGEEDEESEDEESEDEESEDEGDDSSEEESTE